MENKVLIVYNPKSGLERQNDLLDRYQNILKEKGYEPELCLTKGPNHAAEIVEKSDNFFMVLSCGGDGTANQVVEGNSKRNIPGVVCPLPFGSCNDYSQMLGYNKNPIENLYLALSGEIKDTDICAINDNLFIYVVGMGKFMSIPYTTSRQKKSKNGYFAYIREGIDEFFSKTKTYKAKVTADGVELDDEYSLVMISNSNHIAGVPNIYKDVLLDDGQLELLLCKSKNSTDLALNFAKFCVGGTTPNIITLKASNIEIEFEDLLEKNCCIDGEKLNGNVLKYNIGVVDTMPVMVTKEKAKVLFKK